MPPQVYALLVGINEYPAHVGRLYGCVNDVAHVDDYLRNRFDPAVLRTEILRNGDATRQNIIDQFRTHLSQATEDDVVLFHYSGHGARWKSAREFQHLYPDGMDEGLVCADSRLPHGFDLADKELAVLLHEVARNSPHLAVVLDCCHSGSGTRTADDFTQLRSRQTHEVSTDRPLESYLDGYYAALRGKGASLEIPSSRHVLMAACQRVQKAWEGKDHCGVFTSTLLEVLEQSQSTRRSPEARGNGLSYADLFVRCRSAVRKRADNQDPQFETYRGFHAYQTFLGGNLLSSNLASARRRYTVSYEKHQWRVNCGVMHGLPADPEETVSLALYDESDFTQMVGHATTTQVHPQSSDLQLLDVDADTSVTYPAEITSLPIPPLEIGLEGEADGIEQWERFLAENENQPLGIAFVTAPPATMDDAKTRYVIAAEEECYLLKLRGTGEVLQGAKGYSQASTEYLFAVLKRIAEWERATSLQNHWTRMNADLVAFHLSAVSEDDEVLHQYDKGDVVIDVTPLQGETNGWTSFRGTLTAQNLTEQPLQLVLVHFSENYGIQVLYNERIEPTGKEFTVTLDENTTFDLVLEEHEGDRAIHRFKLIVSTEEVDGFLLDQEPLEIGHIFDPMVAERDDPEGAESLETRGLRLGSSRKKLVHQDEWFTKDIQVTLLRQIDRVSVDDVTLANGSITIKGHPSLRGGIFLETANSETRSVASVDPNAIADIHRVLERQGMELLNFAGTRGDLGNVLELSDLQFPESHQEDPLADEPLKIELNVPLSPDEFILPVVFDGDDILLAGETSRNDSGRTELRIRRLPDVPDRQRGIGKAIRLYFFKAMLRRDNVNQLRWVEYQPDGSIRFHDDDVAAKVKSATNILVLLHGILGESAVMARSLSLTQNADGTGVHDKFDLVLTYDYESLGTPVPTTAQQLKRQLKEVGIQNDDGKQVTLLAHSLGGLIARWFVEQEGGQQMVDHLVMFGTPHSGSPIGKVGAARNIALLLTTLAINVSPMLAVSGGLLATFLGGMEKPTGTMEQLNPHSDTIKTLQSSDDPGVHYTLVKGDYRASVAESGGRMARLIAKVGGEALLDAMHGVADHDIVANGQSLWGIDSQRNPSPTMLSAACHHLNYFDSEAGWQQLAAIDWTKVRQPSGPN